MPSRDFPKAAAPPVLAFLRGVEGGTELAVRSAHALLGYAVGRAFAHDGAEGDGGHASGLVPSPSQLAAILAAFGQDAESAGRVSGLRMFGWAGVAAGLAHTLVEGLGRAGGDAPREPRLPPWEYHVETVQDRPYDQAWRDSIRSLTCHAIHEGIRFGPADEGEEDALFEMEFDEMTEAEVAWLERLVDTETPERGRTRAEARCGRAFAAGLPPERRPLADRLAELGRDGWELVSALPVRGGGPRRLYELILKRALA